MAWLPEHFRLTLFTSAQLTRPEIDNLWGLLCETEPEQRSEQPRQGQLTLSAVISSESAFPFLLQLMASPLRVDLLLLPQPNPEAQMPMIAKDITSVATKYLAFSDSLLKAIPSVTRIVFGAALLWPKKSREETYAHLAELLPVHGLNAETASDFFYQINRATKSSVIDDLVINRISKWGSIKSFVIGGSLDNLVSRAEHHATRVELDINTAAENQAVIAHKGSEIIRELLELGIRNAETGDKAE